MTLLLLALLQSAPALPDIQFHAAVQARSVTIRQQGKATLTVRASPDGGGTVKVAAPPARGATLHDVAVTIDAQARLADPAHPPENEQDPSPATEAERPR